ncbi:hypothetical protein L7F22_014582 [Adiantum nelumboides]|nr:hypothetical protein [Adiantum nelumboides]
MAVQAIHEDEPTSFAIEKQVKPIVEEQVARMDIDDKLEDVSKPQDIEEKTITEEPSREFVVTSTPLELPIQGRPTDKEENSDVKSHHEASKRRNSNEQIKNSVATRRRRVSPHEAKARKKTKDTRGKSPVYDVDTPATSDLDVHPKRTRRTPSPSPAYGRRSSRSPYSCRLEESEKNVEKKRRKKKPSRVDVDELQKQGATLINKTIREFGYDYWEIVTLVPHLVDNFKELTHKFYHEHLHPYDESRIILEGNEWMWMSSRSKVPPSSTRPSGSLATTTGVDVDELQKQGATLINKTIKEFGYDYWEIVTLAPHLVDNFKELTDKFYIEHLHPYDESRIILEGNGYWDIPDYDGTMIRFSVEKGDMITLPPGMYHRFTMDTNDYIKAMLLFKEVPERIDILRPQGDDIPASKGPLDNALYTVDIIEGEQEASIDHTHVDVNLGDNNVQYSLHDIHEDEIIGEEKHKAMLIVHVDELQKQGGTLIDKTIRDFGYDYRVNIEVPHLLIIEANVAVNQCTCYISIVTLAPHLVDNFNELIDEFHHEHLHPYDESCIILEENGNFWDIPDYDGIMIRISMDKEDTITLPPGIYHRFK